MEDRRLTGTTAVVVGGTRGIGAAIVRRLCREGATTVFFGRDEQAGAAVASSVRTNGGQADFVPVDALRLDDLRDAISDVPGRHGPINVMVNNAGYALPKSIFDSDEDDFDLLFGLNVKSLYFGMKFGAQHMKDGGGSIINIGSTAATRALANRSLYSGTKGAVLQLTKAAALDLAQYRIRVNLVSPGTVDTWLLRQTRFASSPDQDASVAALGAEQPLGRLGHTDDIASAVAFLASGEAEWITGANLIVDGGQTI